MKPTGERRYAPIPPPETREASWDRWIAECVETVRVSLRREGVDERTIDRELAEIVAEMRDRQYGAEREPDPYADFAPPPPERVVDALPVPSSDVPIEDVPIEDQPTQVLSFLNEQLTLPLSWGRGPVRTTISLELRR
jgi:hypothetical protein